MSHTVTITRLPDEQNDDYEFEFGGNHGGDCAVLMPCKRKACQAMKPEYSDERGRHGREHLFRDGDWLVESDQCALRYVFEQVGTNETFEGLTLGTYPVRVEWEDDWWLEVQKSSTPEQPAAFLDHKFQPGKFSETCQVMLARYRCPYPPEAHPIPESTTDTKGTP